MTSLSVVCVLLALPGPAGAFEGYASASLPTGQLLWRGWSEADRTAMADRIPAELAAVEQALGRRLGQSFTAALVPDGFELSRLVKELTGKALPPARTRGVAIPAQRLLLVRGDPLESAGGLQQTLRHELAHLVLHRPGLPAIPRWVDEGLASWVSGSRLSPEDESRLALLARVRGLYTWSGLEREFPPTEDSSSIAYAQSFLFFRFLAERWGEEAIPRLLDGLQAGASVPTALQATTRLGPQDMEEQFRGWVAARASFLAAFFHGGPGLWSLGGLLALAAILRYRRKLRRYILREERLSSGEGEVAPRELGQG
jgi:hypothetical protein